MARTAAAKSLSKTGKPAVAGRKPAPEAATAPKASAPKPSMLKSSAPKPTAPKPSTPGPGAAAPKPSKDELRSQVEQLTQANAKLRAKGREMSKAARAAAQRIAELEEQVAELESAQAKAAKPPRKQKQPRGIDPGDAAPPGVAPSEPEPMDEEAEAARASLEHNLPSE